MPPSPAPAARYSPGRELKPENHKRGRSLESGIVFREKDDDLALFNEVQNKERDNFLLESNDDLDDIFSTKLRYLSDYKLGISIPPRGESIDLLNEDGDKNDYDWLLTPPDTPLFPSLDEETPPVNLPPRGRPRSQPISISRSSTMDKSYRSSRGSASPSRLSLSPRSGNSTYQSKGSPSSAPRSSPPPNLRHSTPTRRPSPSPSKPSTPPRRSSTPTPRRMSTGSSGAPASSRVRGVSPVKTNRGNSASPKIQAWQSNIPGFSLEAPPNLRTSLADRPMSYVRGSSPASRNGSKSGRQSMSPTASRSVGSSHSQDRDHFSLHSKGSVASSGEDDVDSLQSIPLSSSERSAPRSAGAFSNNRSPGLSKKSNRALSSSSAPKRSFDLAMRQMDHRKGPSNMFRPLLSSVPSSTFYVGKASGTHRSLISRNSSVTTSSNASSDLGTSGAHDTEGSDQVQEDVTSECVKAPFSDVHDEVFVLEGTDVPVEDIGDGIHDGAPGSLHGEFDGQHTVASEFGGIDSCSHHDSEMATMAASEAFGARVDYSNAENLEDAVLCSNCGRIADDIEFIEGVGMLCPECRTSRVATQLTIIDRSENSSTSIIKLANEPVGASETSVALPEALEVTIPGEMGENPRSDLNPDSMSGNCLARQLGEDGASNHLNQPGIGKPVTGKSHDDSNCQKLQLLNDCSLSELDTQEGAGISVLLKRSSSSKGHIVQSRTFIASNINYDDLSCVRDTSNSIRSSLGRGSTSGSSSVDLSSARQVDVHFQRQLSCLQTDAEKFRRETYTKHRRSVSSLSGTSSHAILTASITTCSRDDSFEASSASCVGQDSVEVTNVDRPEDQLLLRNTEVDNTNMDVGSNNIYRTSSESSSRKSNMLSSDVAVPSTSSFEEPISYGNCENVNNPSAAVETVVASPAHLHTCSVEDTVEDSFSDGADVAEAPRDSSLYPLSEVKPDNSHVHSPNLHSDADSAISESSIHELQDPSTAIALVNDTGVSVQEADSNHAHHFIEESVVMLEGQGESKARSLTLDEATDAILFCSSIVQNLAYEAANIAIEREDSRAMEGSRPTVTILGKSAPTRTGPPAGKTPKRNSKSRKTRRKQAETETKPPPSNTESHEKSHVSTDRIVGVTNKADSMKPPKLESKCNCTIM